MLDSVVEVNSKLLQAITILEKWDCNEQQVKRLLGIRFPKTLEMFTVGGTIATTVMNQRAQFIINIDSVMHDCFSAVPNLRYEFINRKNDDAIFKNQTPLQFISRGYKNLERAADRLVELNHKRKRT